ncbi:MAG: hypothetical protein D6796_02605, partial [Caldilineae bacterium]
MSIPSILNLTTLVILLNVAVLFVALRAAKRPVRWSLLLQLIAFDSAVLYLDMTGVSLREMPPSAWFWGLVFLAMPAIFYWGGLAVTSLFLLPVELNRWRLWLTTARTLTSFVNGNNYPYLAYDEEKDRLEERYKGKITHHGGQGLILLRPEHAVVLHKGPRLSRVVGGDVVFTDRLERPLDLVDLQTHILVILDANAVTRDGISIKMPVFAVCRPDPDG